MLTPLNYRTGSELAWGIAKNVYDSRNTGIDGLNLDRATLASISSKFHEKAGTLTEQVRSNLEGIACGNYLLLIPHQPNIFTSLGTLCPFIFLDSLATIIEDIYSIPTAQVYLIVDYDDCADRRFRTANFPDVTRKNGVFSLTGNVPRHVHGAPMWTVTKPSQNLLDNLLNQIQNSVEQQLAIIRKAGICRYYLDYRDRVRANIDRVSAIAREAYQLASTYAEFNSFFVSKIVNQCWNQRISFVPGHELQTHLAPAKKWIFEHASQIQDQIIQARSEIIQCGYKCSLNQSQDSETHLWYYCKECQRRFATRTDGNLWLVDSECKNSLDCIKPRTINKANLSSIGDRLLPKVVADNLIDIISLNKIGGSGYIGQAEHLLISNNVASTLGLQPPPQLIFAPHWQQFGLAELSYYCTKPTKDSRLGCAEEAVAYSYQGKASILYYLLSHGIEELRDGWFQYYSSDGFPNQPRRDKLNESDFYVNVAVDIDWITANYIGDSGKS